MSTSIAEYEAKREYARATFELLTSAEEPAYAEAYALAERRFLNASRALDNALAEKHWDD